MRQKCGTEMYTIESLLPLKVDQSNDFEKIVDFMKKTIRDRCKAMIEWNRKERHRRGILDANDIERINRSRKRYRQDDGIDTYTIKWCKKMTLASRRNGFNRWGR